MAKFYISAEAQPKKVVVETELTPEMFPTSVVELKETVNGVEKGTGFYFGLAANGETCIKTDRIQFVGKEKGVALRAESLVSDFGATIEDAKLTLGGVVDKVTKLEKQIKDAYAVRVANAERIEVKEAVKAD